MSSREPLWFCHECRVEMRPLMTPDPMCASCHGSFVEKIEDPTNDPRHFTQAMHEDMDGDEILPGADILLGLQTLVDRGLADQSRSPRYGPSHGTSGNRLTFQIRTGSSQRADTNRQDRVPTMSEFLRRGPDSPEGSPITGQLMAQYLMAMLSNRDPLNDFPGRTSGDLGSGRMGDYVFNQEALDHIVTQLMENSNSHRPVPATEQIISDLPREVLEHESPLLEKDCAVCKEQFQLETEDPDEQVVVTLPCKHSFHEPCILPWLNSSGTCPVCRHALVAQPEHHSPSTTSNSNSDSDRRRDPSNSSGNRSRRSPTRGDPSILQSLFGGLVGGSDSFGRNAGPSSRHTRSNSDPASRSSGRRSDSRNQFPGGWSEDLD